MKHLKRMKEKECIELSDCKNLVTEIMIHLLSLISRTYLAEQADTDIQLILGGINPQL